MKNETNSTFGVLDQVIADYKENPVDLIDIGDVDGEFEYLMNARLSYQRTVKDVVELFPESQFGTGEPIKILEIGAYLGAVSLTLSRLGFSVTACDIPEFMQNERLQERFRREEVETLTANLKGSKIPATAEKFDLVIMCETLEHLNFNPIPVLLEINRVLKKGGVLYLSLPNLTSLVNRVKLLLGQSIHNPISDFFAQLSDKDNMIVGLHWREYTAGEIRELLDKLGLMIEKQYFFTSNQASFPARLIYKIVPFLQHNQTVIARKENFPDLELSFCDAISPGQYKTELPSLG